jgi:hypothetical protein
MASRFFIKAGFLKYKMTTPMDSAIQTLYGLTEDEFKVLREEKKDQPSELLYGKTMRQVLISLSEDWLKKFNDLPSIFGDTACRNFVNIGMYHNRNIVIDDSGFFPEVEPILDFFGQDNATLIRLQRDGCSFSGDSRNYIFPDIETYEIENNGTVKDLFSKLSEVVYDRS